ncbi:MAG TPA: hypothetical protein VGL78_13695 [Solirubrobacteraceae bacterium]|jgi:hypothetical protein
MPEGPIQILEVRANGTERSVTVTAALTAGAADAIFIALSEQLDRGRRYLTESVEDVLALRRRIELVERFAPLARAAAHSIVQLSEDELRCCLLELSDYRERVDGEHYQPVDLRQRLQLTVQIIAVLWDTNATVAAAADGLLNCAAQ